MNIVVAITGASGAIYAKKVLEKLSILKNQVDSVAVIFSENAKMVFKLETGLDFTPENGITIFENNDFFAPFASGSGVYDVMIICPCSMGTLGRIANGISSDLISRAADVTLKERKKLILVTRESPLNLIHINNMKTVTEAGGIIMPASPSFYFNPQTIEDVVDTVVARILTIAGFQFQTKKWGK